MLTQLNNLDLNCYRISSDGITALANLKDLRSLKISNIRAYNRYNMDLVALFSSLKNLEEVKIQNCVISNEDVVIESLVVNNPNLHHLDINQGSLVTRITSRSLDSIADNCPLLTHIDIGNQDVFTNDDLIKFVSKCSKLKYANFEDTLIEDSTLVRMARDCPDLEHLDISNCRAITLQGVEAFLNKAAEKKLERLEFRDCGFLTNENEYSESVEESLHILEQIYPNIEILYYED